jgi:hypothetical protein
MVPGCRGIRRDYSVGFPFGWMPDVARRPRAGGIGSRSRLASGTQWPPQLVPRTGRASSGGISAQRKVWPMACTCSTWVSLSEAVQDRFSAQRFSSTASTCRSACRRTADRHPLRLLHVGQRDCARELGAGLADSGNHPDHERGSRPRPSQAGCSVSAARRRKAGRRSWKGPSKAREGQ